LSIFLPTVVRRLLASINLSAALPVALFCFVWLPVVAESKDQRPVVYLTFDDGPSADSVTEDILALLAKYDAKATFFVTGERSQKSPEKIAAILYGGHSIGNHTYSHARLVGKSSEVVLGELQTANQAVANAGGPPLTCYRPPFGLIDIQANVVAESLGLTPVKWTLDTRDWHPDVTFESVYHTLNQSRDESVVLMHDGPVRREKTTYAFAAWMSVNADRYQFKALPACETYGPGVVQASVTEPESRTQSISELLVKLRGYQLNLLRAEIQLNRLNQLTANLESDLIKP